MFKTALRVLACGALLLPGTAVLAQTTGEVASGSTNVALATSFVDALTSLGVTPGTVGPSVLTGVNVNFPISGGAFDLSTLKGEVQHGGGLTLSAGGTVVALTNFNIDTTGAAPYITALVTANGKLVGRIPAFNITAGAPELSFDYTPIAYRSNISVTLTSTAATALNNAFGITALNGGLAVGKATVIAVFTPNLITPEPGAAVKK